MPRQLKSEVGAEIHLQDEAQRRDLDVKLPEADAQGDPRVGPGGRAGRRGVRAKPLKETLLQASPPIVPRRPGRAGRNPGQPRPARVSTPVRDPGHGQDVHLQGPDPKSPHLLLVGIDIQTTAKLEPIGGTDVKAAIRKQEGKGSMTSIPRPGAWSAPGWRRRSTSTMTRPGGQSIEQMTETTTSMSLSP